MKWLIAASAYSKVSGGIGALHRLVHLLNLSGEYAAIASDEIGDSSFKYESNKLTANEWDVVVIPEVNKPIPEGIYTNATIVRWVLYYPSFYGIGPKHFSEPIVVTYDKKYFSSVPVFRLFDLNRDIFKSRDITSRSVSSIFLGKGKFNYIQEYQEFCNSNPSWFRITRDEPTDQHNLSLMLNLSKDLYSFDPESRLFLEAKLCGVENIYVFKDMSFQKIPFPEDTETDVSVLINYVKEKRGVKV